MFTLSIETDNAAFAQEPPPESLADYDDSTKAVEVQRILGDVISKIDRGSRGGRLLDANGNTVGSWSLS